MGKGGYGRGNNWYGGSGGWNPSRIGGEGWGPYGGKGQWQPSRSGNGGNGALSGLASQFGNLMGELGALGEMSRLGAIISQSNNAPTEGPPSIHVNSNALPSSMQLQSQGSSTGQPSMGEEVGNTLQKLQGAIEKLSSSQPSSVAVNAQPVPFTQSDFDRMLEKSKPLEDMKSQVSDVKKTLSGFNDQFTNMQNQQTQGFKKLEQMMGQ
eukprot:10108196-Karenia_brevis.AAC.1